MSRPKAGERLAIMLMTRCRCKRVVTALLSGDPHIYHAHKLQELDVRAPWEPIVDSTTRRFEFRNDYDRETGLPIYWEEGYYPR